MNLLADEGVDQPIVGRLRRDGHQVWYVAEMEPGISDDAVIDLAIREGAPLLTADKGFGELVFRQHRATSGVVLVRLAGLSPLSKAEVIASAVRNHQNGDRFIFLLFLPSLESAGVACPERTLLERRGPARRQPSPCYFRPSPDVPPAKPPWPLPPTHLQRVFTRPSELGIVLIIDRSSGTLATKSGEYPGIASTEASSCRL